MAVYVPAGATGAVFPFAAGVAADVRVTSTPGLAALVNAWAGAKTWAAEPAKALTSIGATFPAASTQATGAEVLLQVGTATTVTGAQSPLGLAHWWALLRYYWAFDIAGGLMC